MAGLPLKTEEGKIEEGGSHCQLSQNARKRMLEAGLRGLLVALGSERLVGGQSPDYEEEA